MAVTAANIRLITGFQASAAIGANVLNASGVPWRPSSYTQPLFYDLAGYAGRITKIGYKSGTLAAGASVSVDLTALDSPDGGSGTVSLASYLCLSVQITGTTGLLLIGDTAGANANAMDFGANTYTRTIRPSGAGHLVTDPSGTGYAVSGSAKLVKLTNTHGTDSVAYFVLVGGN